MKIQARTRLLAGYLHSSKIPDTFKVKSGGVTIYVRIAPYMWNPATTRFLVTILPDLPETGYVGHVGLEAPKPYHEATKADIVKRIDHFMSSEDGLKQLKSAVQKYHDYRKAEREFDSQMLKKSAADDAKAKSKGYLYKVDFVVHGTDDDDAGTMYFSHKPTLTEVKKKLSLDRYDVLDTRVTRL